MADNKVSNTKYDWELESLLQGKKINVFFDEWSKKIDETIHIYSNGECFQTLEDFSKYMTVSDELGLLSNRIYNYVSNKYNENLADEEMIDWKQRINYKAAQLHVALSNFANQVLFYKALIEQYLQEPELQKYYRVFELIFRTEPYTLSEAEGKLYATLMPAFSASTDIYKVLADADLKYQPVMDSKERERKINDVGEIHNFLKSSDRVLRKNTFISFANAYESLENSFSQTLYHNYLADNLCAKVHNFKDYISRTAFDDEIDVDFIKFIYDRVADYAKYYKLFHATLEANYRHVLKKKVEPWDYYYPLFAYNRKYTIPDAMEIAKEALQPLGKEYVKNVQRAFSERWISWLPKPAKVSGAYSIGGTKGLDKFYILMNFDQSLTSVYTLVHELGHSMHSLAFNHQPVHAESEIFFAEISSITNEMLLNEYLLKKYRRNTKITLYILQELISNFFATTTRQIVFSDFEFTVNDLINRSQPINPKKIKEIYAEKIVKYYGHDQEYLQKLLTDKYLHMNLAHIFRINHFYDDVFYVYKYAVGQIAAMLNTKNIVDNKLNALTNFKNFLASGNSLSPLDTIKLLGIDLQTYQPWEQVGLIIKDYIKMFAELSREYRKQK